MSKRLTKERLERIKRSYHMDLPLMGVQRVSPTAIYTCNLDIECLVAEVEACWRKRASKKGKVC